MAEEPVAAERFAFGQAAAAAAAACRAARRPPLFSLTPCLPFWSSRPYSPPRNPQMLALLRLPRPPLARSSRVPPSPLRPPPARLAALPATVPGWVGPLSGGGGVRVLDLPLPPTGMLAALGLAIRRPSPPSPPFAPDRSLSPPFAARAVLHAFIQSRASGHGLCAPSPLMGIASVTSQITYHRCCVSLAATLNKELDECRWVIPQARVRTPAGTLAGTLPHGTFVAASGRRTVARQTGMALARRSLPGMPSAARFSSLYTAGRVSGFGPSTLMCPIPVTHTHTGVVHRSLLESPGAAGPRAPLPLLWGPS